MRLRWRPHARCSTPPPQNVPPHVWFAVSAVFHYLGPAFAVLLFPAVGVFGVAWMRIASAALIFAPFTHPWPHHQAAPTASTRLLLVALGADARGDERRRSTWRSTACR